MKIQKDSKSGFLKEDKLKYVDVRFTDQHETLSPVARFDSIRTILSITASNKMYLQKFDIKTFLHGELDDVIYMQQLKGYENGIDRVCKLNRSLYDLKQTSRY